MGTFIYTESITTVVSLVKKQKHTKQINFKQ